MTKCLLIAPAHVSIVVISREPSSLLLLAEHLWIGNDENSMALVGLARNRLPLPALKIIDQTFVEENHRYDAIEIQSL